MNIHNTQDWPYERVAPYGRQITAAMNKLVARFPRDLTLESLAEGVIGGAYQLWLILEAEDFRSVVLTQIKPNEATGNKAVMVFGLAGEDGLQSVPLISEIEAWARSIGASETMTIGRFGWRKAIQKEGYSADTILYRKDL